MNFVKQIIESYQIGIIFYIFIYQFQAIIKMQLEVSGQILVCTLYLVVFANHREIQRKQITKQYIPTIFLTARVLDFCRVEMPTLLQLVCDGYTCNDILCTKAKLSCQPCHTLLVFCACLNLSYHCLNSFALNFLRWQPRSMTLKYR